jgi:hypothetical protein
MVVIPRGLGCKKVTELTMGCHFDLHFSMGNSRYPMGYSRNGRMDATCPGHANAILHHKGQTILGLCLYQFPLDKAIAIQESNPAGGVDL